MSTVCKSISPMKYRRMMWLDDSLRGMAYYSIPNDEGKVYSSLVARSAFMRGDFLYMEIACKKQESNNMKYVCLRINKAEGWDKYLSAFFPTPNLYPVF